MRSSLFTVLVLLASLLAIAPATAQTDCTITGTEGADVLFGTSGDDVICGLGGDDILRGGSGNDVIDGGAGNDLLIGGAGRDQLRGGAGDDRLLGQSGRDRLVGNTGDDRLDGGGSRDRLIGGPGIDDCTDTRGPSKRRACEPVADLKLLAMAIETWDSFEITEFVYAMFVSDHCAVGADCVPAIPGRGVTVHVRDGVATIDWPNMTGHTAEELFDLARQTILNGSPVSYDPTYGLPTELDSVEGHLLIDDFQRRDELRAALESAREQWEAQGAVDYTFTFHNICFCPAFEDVQVTVVDGELAEWTNPTPIQPGMTIQAPKAIDEHLDEIESLLDGNAIDVDAAFSNTIGHPASYSVDYSRLIADEELTVVIFDVEITRAEPPEEEITPPGLTLVDVGGITVNEEMAEQLGALLGASEAEGFVFGGGGYRDPARQVELRRANCGSTDYDIWEKPASQCNPPTAIPGRSQHEVGLAVDFTNNRSLITSRTDPAFVWLTTHAASFGLFNHPQEPWHWSTTGN